MLRNFIEDFRALDGLDRRPGRAREGDGAARGLARHILPTTDVWLLFPAKLYCGQSLLDGRRESVIIDYAYNDDLPGYQEHPDALVGRNGLRIRDEIRMIRPGLLSGPRLRQQDLPAELHALQRRGGGGRHRRLRRAATRWPRIAGPASRSGRPRPSERCAARVARLAAAALAQAAGASPAAGWRVGAPGPRSPPPAGALAARRAVPGRPALPVRGRPRPAARGRRHRRTSQTALVPLGRSLQRYAAAPDYFASPRLVVAVTGDAAAGPGAPRLADRLFLGYQPAAEVIEAISYDETAGRFEFQEIVGYGAARPPDRARRAPGLPRAATRARGPIFARPLWSETNANPADRRPPRAARRELPRRAGARRRVDGLEAFDAATDRAARVAAGAPAVVRGLPRRRLPRRAARRRAARRPRRRADGAGSAAGRASSGGPPASGRTASGRPPRTCRTATRC